MSAWHTSRDPNSIFTQHKGYHMEKPTILNEGRVDAKHTEEASEQKTPAVFLDCVGANLDSKTWAWSDQALGRNAKWHR